MHISFRASRKNTPLVERWTLSGCSPSLAAKPRMQRAPSRCIVSVSSDSAKGSRSLARRFEALSLALSEAHLLGPLRRLRRGLLGRLVGASRLDKTPHAGALHGISGADGVPRSIERGLDGSEDWHLERRVKRSGEAAARVGCAIPDDDVSTRFVDTSGPHRVSDSPAGCVGNSQSGKKAKKKTACMYNHSVRSIRVRAPLATRHVVPCGIYRGSFSSLE